MNMEHQLVAIFCQIDDFCKELETHLGNHSLPGREGGSKRRGPECCLCTSEIMTILVMFQMVRFRNFKTFYCEFLKIYWSSYFKNLPSYNRFVELTKEAIFPLTVFAQLNSGKRKGIYFIDSTKLPVCDLKRQRRHKTFTETAKFGRTSMGWFFGFKLHIVINDHGELIAFKVTQGNKHDCTEAVSLLDSLKGLAFGDKGYIGKKIFENLFEKGLKLITKGRKNMKNILKLNSYEQQLLNQRNLIETVIDHIKHHYMVWHTRHRSLMNAMTHLVAALAAYTIEPLTLSAIKLLSVDRDMIEETPN